MQTRTITTMFFASLLSLGACATTGGVNNAGLQTMQTEEGETVQAVRGLSVADPAPLQCEPGPARHDLVCQPHATDHLYASAMGLDEVPNTNVASGPAEDSTRCDVSRNDGQSCLDGQIASDED